MRSGTKYWAAILGLAAVCEIIAEEGELLSEVVDRGLANEATRPWVAGGILVTAGHLLNLLPRWSDPFAGLMFIRNRLGQLMNPDANASSDMET